MQLDVCTHRTRLYKCLYNFQTYFFLWLTSLDQIRLARLKENILKISKGMKFLKLFIRPWCMYLYNIHRMVQYFVFSVKGGVEKM